MTPPMELDRGALTLSIVVPTLNRRGRVERLVGSILRCEIPKGVPVECLVVDNGSSDGTPEAIEALAKGAPFPVRCIREPEPGASRARNAGIRQATGSVVVFTDDDCEVEPDWLVRIAETFQRMPQLTGLFGRVLPGEAGPIDVSTLSVKSAPEPRDYRWPCSPFIGHGNNMAFRRQSLLAVSGFDVSFGPGAPLRAGEDLELAYRLLRNGAWLRYEPSVGLRHMPRDTEKGMLHGHRRNAIGLGAFFAKWILRGDVHAFKVSVWWGVDALRGYLRAVRDRQAVVARIKGIYLTWVHYGFLLQIAYLCRLTRQGRRGAT